MCHLEGGPLTIFKPRAQTLLPPSSDELMLLGICNLSLSFLPCDCRRRIAGWHACADWYYYRFYSGHATKVREAWAALLTRTTFMASDLTFYIWLMAIMAES